MAVPNRVICALAGLVMAALGWLLLTAVPLAQATPAFGKRTGKACDTCHLYAGSKKLNDVGAYYKRKSTLRGAPLEQQRRADRQKTPSVYYKSKRPNY